MNKLKSKRKLQDIFRPRKLDKQLANTLLGRMESNGNSFTQETAEHLNCTWTISSRMRENIPQDGRVIFWVGTPQKHNENLCLISLIQEVRHDVLMIADDPVIHFVRNYEEQKSPLLIEYSQKRDYTKELSEALQSEKAVIISAPANYEHGRMTWARDVIRLAKKLEAPVVPVSFERGKNLLEPISTNPFKNRLQLPNKEIRINIGEMIPVASFSNLKSRIAARLVYAHQKAINKGLPGILRTIPNVVHQVSSKRLRKEIFQGETLGFTEDNKVILLFEYDQAPLVMQEISRLRELTFRKIGEGTGNRKDTDQYDRFYHHLVLWDDEEMEIVGAYRLGLCRRILDNQGMEGLYSNSLFEYTGQYKELLADAVECGRSFVQEKYWNSMALDYLWHGIGAFIAKNPQITHLFGPVSISQTYTKDARDHLIYFYSQWFRPAAQDIRSRNPYQIAEQTRARLQEQYPHENYKEEFRVLKKNLKMLGFAVPTLYKQYTELCEAGGVLFFDFGVDPDFNNCIDGLIWVHIPQITEKKRDRYINNKENSVQFAPTFLSLSEKQKNKS
ncbi:MAG: lysophospholipid acyltransferase family protein [Leptospiraceae bacterium]|nr:lysophospholipid acyltransferase family protein [Leptospiraceae bacterium]